MSAPPENAKGAAPKDRAQRKTLAREFVHAGSVKASGREEKPLVDRMSEVVRFLQSEWLRHDVLFRALRTEQDRLAALRLARFIDLIREAQNELPPWLHGEELIALAREGRKGVRK